MISSVHRLVRPDMFASIVRALGRRFHSLSDSRSLREVSAHSRNENKRSIDFRTTVLLK